MVVSSYGDLLGLQFTTVVDFWCKLAEKLNTALEARNCANSEVLSYAAAGLKSSKNSFCHFSTEFFEKLIEFLENYPKFTVNRQWFCAKEVGARTPQMLGLFARKKGRFYGKRR